MAGLGGKLPLASQEAKQLGALSEGERRISPALVGVGQVRVHDLGHRVGQFIQQTCRKRSNLEPVRPVVALLACKDLAEHKPHFGFRQHGGEANRQGWRIAFEIVSPPIEIATSSKTAGLEGKLRFGLPSEMKTARQGDLSGRSFHIAAGKGNKGQRHAINIGNVDPDKSGLALGS